MAKAGVVEARTALQALIQPTTALGPALAQQAVFGLALAEDYDSLVAAFGTATARQHADTTGILSNVLTAINRVLQDPLPQAVVDKFPELRAFPVQAVPVPLASDAQQGRFVSATADNVAAPRGRRATTTQDIDFCNHVSVSSPISNSRVDTVLAAATTLLKTSAFSGDVACDVTLKRDGSGGSFGSGGDGLNVIGTNSEMSSVMNNGCARVHVVDAINYCGGSGTNIIGCGWIGGSGIAVVRLSSSTSEGALWLHEFGHNQGLGHTSTSTNIMFPSLGTTGGITSSQCTAFKAGGTTCFAASATVHVAGRGAVRIDSLREGDMVADGSAAGFSPFVAYLHADAERSASFMAVHVAGLPTPLLLTPEHLLFASTAADTTSAIAASASFSAVPLQAMRADAVGVGAYVGVVHANGTAQRGLVVAVERRVERGFVAPLTESGQLVVEGVLASCYADVTGHSHDEAHTAMKPLVWLTRMFPALARQPVGHSDMHWYAQVLVRLVRMGNDAAARLDELRAMLV
jgi:hypothetical protein